MTIAGHHNPGAASERPARTKRAKLRGAGPEPLELSERHLDVLRLAAEGLTDIQIGQTLHIAVGTVKNHMTAIYALLGARNRAHAVALGFRRHLLPVPQLPPAQPEPPEPADHAARMTAAGWKQRAAAVAGVWVPAQKSRI